MRDATRDGRVVYVDGEISGTMRAERRLLRELFLTDRQEPMQLVIASPGGAVTGALALLDEITVLRRQGAHIDALVEGFAMSAAAVILQGCRRRYAGSSAMLMLHGGTGMSAGDEIDAEASRAWRTRYHEQFATVVGGRTAPLGGWSVAQWRKRFRSNVPLYFTAPEALAAGLIDEVVS